MAVKKTLKIVFISLVTTIFIGCVVTFIVVKNIDHEIFKNTITKLIHTSTNKELKIAGDVSLKFIPQLGIKINDVTVNSSPGFTDKELATIKTLEIYVKPLPLLLGHVVVDSLNIDGLDLYLIENSAGKYNWQDSPTKNHTTSNVDNTVQDTKFVITFLNITNSSILWHKQKTKTKILLTDLKLQSKIHKNKTINANIDFACYQGRGTGKISADFHNPRAQFILELNLTNLQAQNLLSDLANYSNFSGRLNIQTHLAMQGTSGEEILSSINGKGNMVINNGSYHDIDIPYEVRRAHAMINLKPIPPQPTSQHTDFDRLNMPYTINNAVLNTANIDIKAQDYYVTGKGNANLVTQHLDFILSAYSNNDTNFFIPIKITGNTSNPQVRPNSAVIIGHTLRNAVKNIIQKPIGKHLQKLGENITNLLPLDKILN